MSSKNISKIYNIKVIRKQFFYTFIPKPAIRKLYFHKHILCLGRNRSGESLLKWNEPS